MIFSKFMYSYGIQIKLYGYKFVKAAKWPEKTKQVVQKELHKSL